MRQACRRAAGIGNGRRHAHPLSHAPRAQRYRRGQPQPRRRKGRMKPVTSDELRVTSPGMSAITTHHYCPSCQVLFPLGLPTVPDLTCATNALAAKSGGAASCGCAPVSVLGWPSLPTLPPGKSGGSKSKSHARRLIAAQQVWIRAARRRTNQSAPLVLVPAGPGPAMACPVAMPAESAQPAKNGTQVLSFTKAAHAATTGKPEPLSAPIPGAGINGGNAP